LADDKTNATSRPAATFERALEQLEQVVASLEEGRCGLTDSLAHYERGVKLLRECYELLSQAERKIEVLAGFDAEGNPVTEPLLENDGESLEDKVGQRSRRRSHAKGNGPRKKPDDDIPF
jgi:exodeoxyribonuclease VII small subunit